MGAIVIEMAGEPRGKSRPRFVRKTGIAYTPAKTRSYEGALRFAAMQAMDGAPPIEGPVRVQVYALFSVPKSWSKIKRLAALSGVYKHTSAPDLDNIMKDLDAFNQIVWCDDRQVFAAEVKKGYSDRPRLRIVVEAML